MKRFSLANFSTERERNYSFKNASSLSSWREDPFGHPSKLTFASD
jgi:hypothetical protein